MGWKYGLLFLQDGRNTQATETNAEVEFYLHLINFLVWDWATFRFDYLTTLPCNTGNLEQMHNPHTDSGFNFWCCICLREDSGDLSAIGETLRWEEQALKSNSINMQFQLFERQSMCVWARWAGFCNVFRLLGLCDFPFQMLAAFPLLSFSPPVLDRIKSMQ